VHLSSDGRVVSVPVTTTAALALGRTVTLLALQGRQRLDFDISADGSRFLALVPEVAAGVADIGVAGRRDRRSACARKRQPLRSACAAGSRPKTTPVSTLIATV
jgi:hypothetical protein